MIIDLPKIFEGETITILGGGYSLHDFDWSRVKGKAIAVNYSVLRFPDAALCVACDGCINYKKVIINNIEWDVQNFFKMYKGIMVTDREPQYEGGKKVIYEGVAMTDSERDLDWHCQSANNSGFVSLALAFHLGATKVFLLGFDGGYDKISNHYYHNANIESKVFESFNYHYQWFKDHPVINVINPAFESKIECFKKVDINTNFYGNY